MIHEEEKGNMAFLCYTKEKTKQVIKYETQSPEVFKANKMKIIDISLSH